MLLAARDGAYDRSSSSRLVGVRHTRAARSRGLALTRSRRTASRNRGRALLRRVLACLRDFESVVVRYFNVFGPQQSPLAVCGDGAALHRRLRPAGRPCTATAGSGATSLSKRRRRNDARRRCRRATAGSSTSPPVRLQPSARSLRRSAFWASNRQEHGPPRLATSRLVGRRHRGARRARLGSTSTSKRLRRVRRRPAERPSSRDRAAEHGRAIASRT